MGSWGEFLGFQGEPGKGADCPEGTCFWKSLLLPPPCLSSPRSLASAASQALPLTLLSSSGFLEA